jgi:lysophospholipase L1-like esterase
MSLDDLHPNAAGERILAELAAKALNAAYELHIPWQRTLVER